MPNIKIAIAPIGWSNDDMPELGADISFQQCIKEMAEAHYQGCEVGHKFPKQTDVLQKALNTYQLEIASAWYSTYFTENKIQETINGFIQHMLFLKTMGAKIIVVCECGHSIQGNRQLAVLNNKPVFNTQHWKILIDGLHTLGELANKNDMIVVYHHHMGTGVQSESEIDYLMDETLPELLSLLLDTGHLYFAGYNPIITLQKHGPRIKHIHLKDIRPHILKRVKKNQLSFLDAVRAGVFTVPGDGCIDFARVFDFLLSMNYQGWLVVEAEQDPEKANPLYYAKMGRDYVRKLTGI